MQETLVWFLGWEDLLERDRWPTPVFVDFPDGSDGKEFVYNEGDLGLIPGLGRSPGRGHGNSLQYSCLENLHGQRSLVDYNPWGWTWLNTAQHTLENNSKLNESQAGIKISRRNINNLRYADDTTSMAGNEEEQKNLWQRWKKRVKMLA